MRASHCDTTRGGLSSMLDCLVCWQPPKSVSTYTRSLSVLAWNGKCQTSRGIPAKKRTARLSASTPTLVGCEKCRHSSLAASAQSGLSMLRYSNIADNARYMIAASSPRSSPPTSRRSACFLGPFRNSADVISGRGLPRRPVAQHAIQYRSPHVRAH